MPSLHTVMVYETIIFSKPLYLQNTFKPIMSFPLLAKQKEPQISGDEMRGGRSESYKYKFVQLI